MSYTDHYESVTVLGLGDGGWGYAIAEDEDGFPILVLPDLNPIPLHVWQEAYDEYSIMMIVNGVGHGISTEEFLAERTEKMNPPAYEIPPTSWRKDFTYPKVREYLSGPSESDPNDLGTFVHLHTHTEYSSLDGLSTLEEVATVVTDHGQKAVGSCDHGNCASHPEQQAVADKYGIKPIFGMEAYFVDDRHRRTRKWWELDGVEVDLLALTPAEKKKATEVSDSAEVRGGYTHLSLWAEDQQGLRNLWAVSTEGWREGLFDGNPRVDWDTLRRLGGGVICGTGCLRGPVAVKILEGDMDGARDVLMRLAAIYGDRLYVEIHANTLDDQKVVNKALIDLASQYKLPLVMAVDSHYAISEQKPIHEAWVRMQTGKTMAEELGMFQGSQDYHLLTEAEIREKCSYLPTDAVEESMANTVEIARRCTAEVKGAIKTPTYSKPSKDYPDPIKRDAERMMEICLENWERRTKGKNYTQQVAMDRLEREANLLVNKQFCGYFLIVWDYVSWAKKEGCLVGPSRGSGGGSFVAYLMGITETDPIQNDLIFERFLTEGRTSLPDFDIDFPTSWRNRVTNYIRQRWGQDYTANIGTLLRLRAKQAINDAYRVMESVLPYEIPHQDREGLKKLVDEANAGLAGKQLPWDDFCHQFAEQIDPMRQAWPEFFTIVDNLVDRLKTYGKHAAGIVISTDDPLTDLPMYQAEIEERINGKKVKTKIMVTQFDMNALELLGYVKFDILTLRTLDTLQETVDMIHAKLGVRINPYDWHDEYEDPQVWEQVSDGKTLGLFQVETATGHRMVRRMKPVSLEDLAAVVTVVRPGPMRSGLTDSFLRRRAGIEPVSYPDARMEAFVGNTYGAMIYQEQVMAACMTLAGYDSNEADAVRKLLGKKQVEKVVAAGQEFISRAVPHGTDPAVAEMLWGQMAEFAKYGFNRAHAFAYAVLGYWCVAGPTRLFDWDKQEYVTISKAYKQGISRVSAYDEVTGKTVGGEVDRIVKTGMKMGYVLRTKSNKRLEASADHLILTDRGWVRMGDIQQGDRVASERRVSEMDPNRRAQIAESMKCYWKNLPEDETQRRIKALNDGQDFVFRSEKAKARWDVMDQVERQERVAALIDSARGGRWASRRTGVSSECGHRYASRNEREVCRWFDRHGLEHKSQEMVNGRPADFWCQGVYIEFDGLNRSDAYFDEKFGDEPYVVIRDRHELDRDLGFLLEKDLLLAGGVVTFEPIVSITPTREVMMYDIIMKDDPHNFLADGVVAHNTAWLKFHFPVEFLVACMSTVDVDRVPEFIEECRLLGYEIYPPNINLSKVDFTGDGVDVIWGLSMIKNIGQPMAEKVVQHQPYSSFEDFIEKCVTEGSPVNMGTVKTLTSAGAFDSLVENRKALEIQLEREVSGEAKRCVHKVDLPQPSHPSNLPCGFDWDNEPDPPLIPKGRGKAKVMVVKPPQKACNIKCRQYKKPDSVGSTDIEPYTEEEIMQKEREILGVWITASPWDKVDPVLLDNSATASIIENAPASDDLLYGVCLVEAVKKRKDKNQNDYAFVTLNMQDGRVEPVCFSIVFDEIRRFLEPDALGVAAILKTTRGTQLVSYSPYPS